MVVFVVLNLDSIWRCVGYFHMNDLSTICLLQDNILFRLPVLGTFIMREISLFRSILIHNTLLSDCVNVTWFEMNALSRK